MSTHPWRLVFRIVFRLAAFVLLLGPALAQPADWQAAWARTLAAARQEGKLVMCVSPGAPRRDYLLKQWKEDFPDIELSVSTVSGSAFVPSVVTERAAGKYLWDVFGSGPNTGVTAVRAGLFDALLPELILPEVRDPAIWGGWEDAFYDADKKYVLGLLIDLETPYYNALIVPPDKAKTLGLKLLLDPAYRGRIVWYDPRIEGPGSPHLPLIARVLGEESLRRLITEQEPVFVGNFNDVASAIVRGKADIGLGGNSRLVLKEYYAAGMKLDVRPLGNNPEVAWRGTDGNTVAVFNKRPHPNAARLFVNWLMTKRIAAGIARVQDYDSRRADVPPLDPDFAVIPGAAYVDAQREENDTLMRRLMAEAKRLRPQ
jgi:ABC-type Fe3+ transport system substrate-binding protein